jgi:hypothetical protein
MRNRGSRRIISVKCGVFSGRFGSKKRDTTDTLTAPASSAPAIGAVTAAATAAQPNEQHWRRDNTNKGKHFIQDGGFHFITANTGLRLKQKAYGCCILDLRKPEDKTQGLKTEPAKQQGTSKN